MKKLKIKLEDDETVFHRQAIFQKEEELIIFPIEEFIKFHGELKRCLEKAISIVEQSAKSKNSPYTDAQRICNWIKLMENEINKMEKTDTQKKLFNASKTKNKRI